MTEQATYRAAIRLGLAFLERHYDAHGGWWDFPTFGTSQHHAVDTKMARPLEGESTTWVTGYVAKCIFDGGLTTPSLPKAIDLLVADQLDDGGWGWGPPAPSDCDTTATCAMLLLAAGVLRPEQMRRAIGFILSHQKANGGLSTFSTAEVLRTTPLYHDVESEFKAWCNPHVSVTATAVQTMAKMGASRESIAAAYDFLRASQRVDGLWTCYWWVAEHYATLQVAKAVAPPFDGLIDTTLTVTTLLETQDGSGAWLNRGAPCPFSTALAVQTLRLLPDGNAKARTESCERGRRWLVDVQQENGSWIAPLPIMRIPDRELVEPGDPSSPKSEEEELKFDVHHVFTTASVCQALSTT
jgi:squalene cyclase